MNDYKLSKSDFRVKIFLASVASYERHFKMEPAEAERRIRDYLVADWKNEAEVDNFISQIKAQ